MHIATDSVFWLTVNDLLASKDKMTNYVHIIINFVFDSQLTAYRRKKKKLLIMYT